MSNLYHHVSGKGDPIVLIHGFCEDHRVWSGIQQKLAEDFCVHAVDLPGFGKSPSIPGLDITGAANLLADWMDEQGLEKPVMIGHSLGGYITLEFLSGFSHKLKGISLVHSSSLADSEDKKASRRQLIRLVEEGGRTDFLTRFAPSLFNPHRREELSGVIREFSKQSGESTAEAIVLWTRAMIMRNDHRAQLQNPTVPIQFVAGKFDEAVPYELSLSQRDMSSSKVEFHTLENSGHMGMLEEPDVMIHLLNNFLKNLHD